MPLLQMETPPLRKADDVLVSTAPVLISGLRKRSAFCVGLVSAGLSRAAATPLIRRFAADDDAIGFGVRSGLSFGCYSALYNSVSLRREVTPLRKIAIGIAAELAAELGAFPLRSMRAHPAFASGGLLRALAEITAADGARGLYRGVFPHLLRALPGAAAAHVANEALLARCRPPLLKYSLSSALAFSADYAVRGGTGFWRQFCARVPVQALRCALVEELQRGYLVLCAARARAPPPVEAPPPEEEEAVPVEQPKFWKWEWF